MSDSSTARERAGGDRRSAPDRATGALRTPWLPIAVGVLAFAIRLQMELRGGGILGIGAYDDGVHLSAADAVVHGRLPYGGFLFLQPPGMLLAAAPFAWLAGLIGDPTALEAFRVTFELVGAMSAVVVVLVLRRFGPAAAVSGGLLYAVFAPAVYDERTALLEPAGTLAVLVALLLLPRALRGHHPSAFAVGAALGIACDFKIWYVVTALVVLALARTARIRIAIGAVVTGALGYLPFFVRAPQQMFQQVVLDQLGRPSNDGADLLIRLQSVLGVRGVGSPSTGGGVPADLLLVVLAVLVIAAGTVALRDERARVFVAIAAADLVVVLAAPSYFPHYAALVAPLLALLVGVAIGRASSRLTHRAGRIGLVTVVLVGVVLLNAQHDLVKVGTRPPAAALRAASARIPGCVVADDPTILAVMDVLTRDLDRGCPLRPDVSGYSYGPDRTVVAGVQRSRPRNARYQAGVVAYLRSGGAFIRVRKDTALSAASIASLGADPVLFRSGRWVIRASGR